MSLTIDVISDVVCPWCFIGKRRLEGALERWAEAHPGEPGPQVHWHPFQLNPRLAPEGMPRAEYVERKFGPRGAANYERVAAVGREVGIPFAFDRIRMQPNTVASHALIALAAAKGAQDRLVETLFSAYFLEGVDLTSRDNLIELGMKGGLTREECERVLDDNAVQEQVVADEERAREIGVEGVPFFIFNRKLGVSGAQPVEVLLEAMEQAAA